MKVIKLQVHNVLVLMVNACELSNGVNDVLYFVFVEVKGNGFFLLPKIQLALLDQPCASFVLFFHLVKVIVDDFVARSLCLLELSRHLDSATQRFGFDNFRLIIGVFCNKIKGTDNFLR